MSGVMAVAAAIKRAESPENEGSGYTLHLWMQGGREFHGAVVQMNAGIGVLELELWERQQCEGDPEGQWPQPTGRHIRIDASKVEAVGVCW